MRSHEGTSALSLTVGQIESIAADLTEDFQRQANQGIRKKDWEQGIGALASMQCLETLLYNCRLRAGVFSPASPQGVKPYSRRSERIKEIKRAVSIEELRNKRGAK